MTARSLPLKFLVLLMLAPAGRIVTAQIATAAAAPSAVDADEISESEGRLIHDVRVQLVAEQFDEIDRAADSFRRDKSRWNGGGWKLRTLYEALDAPHQTDKDTTEHLAHLEKWMRQRPESITARVALATSLTRWAWVGRGNSTADKVTAEGWQQFNDRAQEAQAVLEGSRDMRTMCPQWYSEEMTVGLALGWDAHRMQELFERAVQFEPDYQYFYKSRTNYLLPKWYGSDHVVTKFAQDAANRRGGELGDYLYFEMATVILKRGNGDIAPLVKGMDWDRIQRGYQALQTLFGANRGQKNEMAFMAYKFSDLGVARQQFASIGQEWSRGVWRDRNFFEKVRDWSNGATAWP